MPELIWTEKVVESLEHIFEYIAADSPKYARSQMETIIRAVERLQLFPESGRSLPELPNLPYREVIIHTYRIIYRYDKENDKVFVINTVHGNRLLTDDLVSVSHPNRK